MKFGSFALLAVGSVCVVVMAVLAFTAYDLSDMRDMGHWAFRVSLGIVMLVGGVFMYIHRKYEREI